MIEKTIQQMIAPSLEQEGLEVVRVMIMGDQAKILQIMLDRSDETPLSIDDCSHATSIISALLDVHDPFDDHYTLEVSSPGIDRPLTRLKDFERFKGHIIKLELNDAIDGRRRFQGLLKGLDGNNICLEVDEEDLQFNFNDIYKSKLIMCDDLFNEGRN